MEYTKIALLGFGLEAQSAYNFLRKKHPHAEFEIYDQNPSPKINPPQGVKTHFGVKDFANIDADLIVRTPAVNPNFLPKNIEITSTTNLFFENCPAKIIGVTGTKGKGTVSSFIASILRASGKKVHLVGNIGVPSLDVLPEISQDDAVIYEMSSFQLWDIKKSPHIAVILMIEQDHLDVHADFEEYLQAKSNIRKHQKTGDFCIYASDENSSLAANISAEGEAFEVSNISLGGNNLTISVEDGFFWRGEEKICSTEEVKLPGLHNIENAKIAISACFLYDENLPFQAVASGLRSFHGLPHRLKFVREISGVKFYDDSISTTIGSALAAINSFSQPKVLILGGSDKGADISKLIKKIAQSDKNEIRKVILYGAVNEKLAKMLVSENFSRFENLGLETNMQEIVKTAFENSKSGDVVILSPAHASFDLFKNYADRGEKFVEAVENL